MYMNLHVYIKGTIFSFLVYTYSSALVLCQIIASCLIRMEVSKSTTMAKNQGVLSMPAGTFSLSKDQCKLKQIFLLLLVQGYWPIVWVDWPCMKRAGCFLAENHTHTQKKKKIAQLNYNHCQSYSLFECEYTRDIGWSSSVQQQGAAQHRRHESYCHHLLRPLR